MSALPVVSGREVIRALEKTGYVFDRQRGSHMILRRQDPPYRRLAIPDHRESPGEHCAPSFDRLPESRRVYSSITTPSIPDSRL